MSCRSWVGCNVRETEAARGLGSWLTSTETAYSNRDKASLDIFWLRNESLEESTKFPGPDILAQEIVEDLEAALEQFREIVADLGAEHVNLKEIKEPKPVP